MNVPRHASRPGQHLPLEHQRAWKYRLLLKQILEELFLDEDALSVGLMPGHRIDQLQGRGFCIEG